MGTSVSRYYGKAMGEHFQKRGKLVFLDSRGHRRAGESIESVLRCQMKEERQNGYNGGSRFKSQSLDVKVFSQKYGATRCNIFGPSRTPWSAALERSDGIIYFVDHYSRTEGKTSLKYILETFTKPLILFGTKEELQKVSESHITREENDFFKIFSFDVKPSPTVIEEALEWISTSIGIANASKWVEEDEREDEGEEDEDEDEEWEQSIQFSLEEPGLPNESIATTDLPN